MGVCCHQVRASAQGVSGAAHKSCSSFSLLCAPPLALVCTNFAPRQVAAGLLPLPLPLPLPPIFYASSPLVKPHPTPLQCHEFTHECRPPTRCTLCGPSTGCPSLGGPTWRWCCSRRRCAGPQGRQPLWTRRGVATASEGGSWVLRPGAAHFRTNESFDCFPLTYALAPSASVQALAEVRSTLL